MSVRVIVGDCRETLQTLPDESVQMCVTSPPYYGLRDYGHPGQLGLERTPAEYIEKMVAVFREVRRVMRDDGTLWLNIGDSYAGSGPISQAQTDADIRHATVGNALAKAQRRIGTVSGLKQKDLIGIPWLLAKALRDPYYTGSIKDERDRIWLAAMLDAEGCLFIHKRKAGQHNGQGYFRTNDNYGPGLEISNTHRAIVERIAALVGKGSICEQESGKFGRKQTLYRWNLRTTESREFVREMYPYLVAKRQQARILYGCPSNGEKAEAAHSALKMLHQGVETSVDFPAPEPMYEPGFYLRSDIIWNKCNPMPESVTDRPTKSHEYLFLLSKSASYSYDADAIREGCAVYTRKGTAGGHHLTQQPGYNGIAGGTLKRDPDEARGFARDITTVGRNSRSVWTIATQPYKGAHFATFPPKLIEPCIKAGSKEGDTVLDPFGGAGTTGLVADRLGRNAILCELSEEYAAMARGRLHNDSPLFMVQA